MQMGQEGNSPCLSALGRHHTTTLHAASQFKCVTLYYRVSLAHHIFCCAGTFWCFTVQWYFLKRCRRLTCEERYIRGIFMSPALILIVAEMEYSCFISIRNYSFELNIVFFLLKQLGCNLAMNL